MQFDWWTFALQTVNFLVLVWLLHRFLYRPVLRMIDQRRAEIEKERTDAVAVKAEAQDELAAAAAERDAAARERAATLKEAADLAEKMAAERRARAERDAEALLTEARDKLAAERDEAIAETRRAALDFGLDIARRLLGEVPEALRAEAWIEKIEEHLATLPAEARADLVGGSSRGPALRIVTAAPIPEASRRDWQARLAPRLGDLAQITFEVDADLVAGAELHFPHAILYFSWRSSLAALREKIEAHEAAR